MSQIQSEQNQKLLQQFQQQMEEEMLLRQNMMQNQFQLMTKLQSDFPAFDAISVFDLKKDENRKSENLQKELKAAMHEKISDIEIVFKAKEDKIIENYEQVIKDLENKLDMEHKRYRDAADFFKEEKERLVENHKTKIERIHEDNRSMYDAIKSEYMVVIQNLKSLRKLEFESTDEMNDATRRINRLSLELEKKSQDNLEERISAKSEQEKNFQHREEELKRKDIELQRLQDTILIRQETSDNERKKLTEAILKLESKLHKKEMELESERRQTAYEKEQLEYQTKQFEQEKEAFLINIEIEKKKIFEERDSERKKIDRLKKEHYHQIKQLKLEKAKYAIHKRLKHSEGIELGFEMPIENGEIEQQLKVLEQVRVNMKKTKIKLKAEEKNLEGKKRKLYKQRQEVTIAIEKLYDVERGINEKFSNLEKLRDLILKIKTDGVEAIGEFKNLNYGVDQFLTVIEEALLDLLKQEQKIKSETVTLNGERKKINNTISSVLCSACSRPIRKSFSSKDLRNLGSWEQEEIFNMLRSQPGYPWMDPQGEHQGKVSSRILGSRTSCDGASLEAVDTHVSALKKDAENDKKYLKDEVEYLKTLQKINIKTLAKYQ